MCGGLWVEKGCIFSDFKFPSHLTKNSKHGEDRWSEVMTLLDLTCHLPLTHWLLTVVTCLVTHSLNLLGSSLITRSSLSLTHLLTHLFWPPTYISILCSVCVQYSKYAAGKAVFDGSCGCLAVSNNDIHSIPRPFSANIYNGKCASFQSLD